MSKTILTVVKILGGSIIFSLIFSFSVYIIQLENLDNRISSLQDSMASIVSQQNYLPESARGYYELQFNQIEADMGDDFFVGWTINHSGMSGHITPAGEVDTLNVGSLIESNDLADVGTFGSVKVIDIVVEVKPPLVGGITGNRKLHFTMAVPCQQYQKVY